jgi:hypothetical protein
MSGFFGGRTGQPQQPPPPRGTSPYTRVPDGSQPSLPSGPRAGHRVPPPARYDDPGQFEKRSHGGGAPSQQSYSARRCVTVRYPISLLALCIWKRFISNADGVFSAGGQTFALASLPNNTLALTNCAVVNPGDFTDGAHLLIKQNYVLTSRCVAIRLSPTPLPIPPQTRPDGHHPARHHRALRPAAPMDRPLAQRHRDGGAPAAADAALPAVADDRARLCAPQPRDRRAVLG